MTSFSSQVAFPPLSQSSVYSGFPQSGQTYGLPPFGQCSAPSPLPRSCSSASALLSQRSSPVSLRLSTSASSALLHLQVLCGPALKLRLGYPRRPLVVSPGFSASAPHIPQHSPARCTTHTRAKASRSPAPHLFSREVVLLPLTPAFACRLQLHHVQRVLQHPLSCGRHRSHHRGEPPGEEEPQKHE